MKLGFAGLGRMGVAMVRNLAAAGHTITVWNRSPDKSEALRSEGMSIAATPSACAAGADFVFTMLADDTATDEVALGPDGLATALSPHAAHICCATISTELARRLTTEHASRGQSYLSAPVFGRPDAAAAAKVVVVAAGSPDCIERARPLLSVLGRQTVIAGPEPWHANIVKLMGNFTIVSVIETLGEAFAVLRKSGVDPEVFMDAINEVYTSIVYRGYGGMMAKDQVEPAGFALRLGLKDVRMIMKAAEECGAPLPLASMIRDNFLSALAHGQGEMDWSSLGRVAARNAGL